MQDANRKQGGFSEKGSEDSQLFLELQLRSAQWGGGGGGGDEVIHLQASGTTSAPEKKDTTRLPPPLPSHQTTSFLVIFFLCVCVHFSFNWRQQQWEEALAALTLFNLQCPKSGFFSISSPRKRDRGRQREREGERGRERGEGSLSHAILTQSPASCSTNTSAAPALVQLIQRRLFLNVSAQKIIK